MTVTARTTGIPEEWWENFEPPHGYRAEIIQGELVLRPSPGAPHAYTATVVMAALMANVPAGFAVVQNLEWRLPKGGYVAAAPIPDLMVIPLGLSRVVEPPLLAVEILSPSDHGKLRDGRTVIEGKQADYAANGLGHYLQVDVRPAAQRSIARFELVERLLIQVREVLEPDMLVAEAPYPYQIHAADL